MSVVIPAFGAERWIRDALQSVAEQKFDDGEVEAIVVDDGSTDGTVATARRALNDFGLPGRVIERGMNGGASAARNTGWQSGQGEWIQFLDADDRLGGDKLATQMRAALEVDGRCGVIYSPWQRLRLDAEAWVPDGPVEDPVFGDPVVGIIEDKWFGYVGPCLVRREALVELGGFDETKSLGEDLDLMLRLAIAGWSFHHAGAIEPLFFYRLTPGSLWQRARKDPAALNGKNETETNAEAYLRRMHGGHLSVQTRQAFAERYIATYQHAKDFNKPLARALLGQIADLRLRTAPSNAPRIAHALAPAVGLGYALRAQALFRRVFPAA